MKDKKGDVMEIGKEQDTLMEKLKALQQIFDEEKGKAQKGAKTIQVPQKYLKLVKSSRKLAYNSTSLYSDGFKITTGKSQGSE